MFKLSQETIAIVAVGLALAGMEIHGRIEARADREAVRDALNAHAAESRTAQKVTHEVIRAENQAVREAVTAISLTGQAEGAVDEIIEKMRSIAEHIEEAAP